MAEAKQQPKGRFRSWLDKRREAQRRGSEISQRMNTARKGGEDQGRRHGSGGDGGGPFMGGI
jgi:hypothetical protein